MITAQIKIERNNSFRIIERTQYRKKIILQKSQLFSIYEKATLIPMFCIAGCCTGGRWVREGRNDDNGYIRKTRIERHKEEYRKKHWRRQDYNVPSGNIPCSLLAPLRVWGVPRQIEQAKNLILLNHDQNSWWFRIDETKKLFFKKVINTVLGLSVHKKTNQSYETSDFIKSLSYMVHSSNQGRGKITIVKKKNCNNFSPKNQNIRRVEKLRYNLYYLM